MSDIQTRKFQLTINNDLDKGYSLDVIKERLSQVKNLQYFCYSREVGGTTSTPHCHIFIYRPSAMYFSHIKKLFPEAHIEAAKGTSQQNRDYVFKLGKFAKSEKGMTNIEESHYEFGTLPNERPGARNDLDDLYDMIAQGLSDYEIVRENPSYMLRLDEISKVRNLISSEKYKRTFRNLETEYIWGSTGVGKSKSIIDKYGYDDIYRVTDYQSPFDEYSNQSVIILEEFRSSLPLSFMLNFLDGYPLQLHCRFRNKFACFTKVFIISNIPLKAQYLNVQKEEPESYKALLRRINKETYIGKFETYSYPPGGNPQQYGSKYIEPKLFDSDEPLPFS